MSKLPPDRRNARARATRLAVGCALLLVLAIGIAAAVWPGRRGGNPGADAGNKHAGAPATGGLDTVASADPRESGADDSEDAGEGGEAADETADAWDDPGGRNGGRHRETVNPGAGTEELLAAWDHLERQIGAAIERARESVVELEYTPSDSPLGERRVASGVVISPRGEVLAVRIDPPRAGGGGKRPAGAEDRRGASVSIVARDHLGRAHVVQWLAADPYTGLTLLRISPRAVRPIHAATERPKLGSQVFIVGSPFGLGHSASRGHVAGLDRALKLSERRLGGLVQIQAPLYPGDSGAAVVDLRGDWLGLVRGGLANRGSAAAGGGPLVAAAPLDAGVEEGPAAAAGHAGAASVSTDREPAGDDELSRPADQDTHFGFAIPSRDALWIADQLRQHGRVDRAYLGVHFVHERPVAAAEAEPPGDPGAAGGSGATPGARAWRGAGGTGQADSSVASAARNRDAELSADAPTPREGARLLDVLPDSPAERAGLQPGDRIVGVNGQPIRSRNDLIDRLDRIPARTTIVVGVVREDDADRPRFDVQVQTASRPSSRQPSAGRTASAGHRPGRASIEVTPTASRTAPPASRSEPPAKGPEPSASTPARAPTPTPASPSPSPSPSARPSPSPPAPVDSPGPAGRADGVSATRPKSDRGDAGVGHPALSELKLNLPRAVVERLEHIERRLDQMEHFREPAAAGHPGNSPARPSGSRAPGDRPGPASP